MEITKLQTQAHNPDRVSVFVDGEFYLGVHRLVAMQMGLRVGLTLNPRLVKQLETQTTDHSAWEAALKSLQYSPKSRQMLANKLSEKFDPPTVQDVLARLTESQILDDFKLAEDLVRQRAEQGSKSRRQIGLWLKTKLFEKTAIDEALAQLDEGYDMGVALEIAQRKYLQLSHKLESRKLRDRVSAYLAQRGFNYGVIKEAVNEVTLADAEHLT